MITAKTESGFSIELEDDALEDQELDAISGMQDGNVFSMSHLTDAPAGHRRQKSACTTILRTTRRPCARPWRWRRLMDELFQSINAGKISASSPN